ncbi:hypothetical protein AVEN_61903-1 [Araneus ventricosus]|uniref:Apple domain-containing protein n=1 Tax=Araneus ventricosus TaxID=182803 RepID=A0A4Y2QYB5_ARAVE|nr:hypothetical protein AVEN_61903-1 [Araneus ventricosus]
MSLWYLAVSIAILIAYSCTSCFEVSNRSYDFVLQDKLHEDWVLQTIEDGHMISCLQNCWNNTDCSGIAIGNFTEDSQNYSRICHTLTGIDTSQCEDEDSCPAEGYFVFQPKSRAEQLMPEKPSLAGSKSRRLNYQTPRCAREFGDCKRDSHAANLHPSLLP